MLHHKKYGIHLASYQLIKCAELRFIADYQHTTRQLAQAMAVLVWRYRNQYVSVSGVVWSGDASMGTGTNCCGRSP